MLTKHDLKKIVVAKQSSNSAKILFRAAQTSGFKPSWLIPDSIFVVSAPKGEVYVNLAKSAHNSDINASLAKNKYVARLILERHGLPNIPFALPKTLHDVEDFINLHGTIIAKPVRGAGTNNIHIVATPDQMPKDGIERYIIEKYITGIEVRYLILNNKVIAVHQSDYGVSVKADRDLDRISISKKLWDKSLVDLSLKIGNILNLNFLAVDFLIDATGEAFVLEVNTQPGLKWFHAPTSGPVVDVASLFMKSLVR